MLVARETGVLLALLVMCVFLSLTTDSFLSVRNLFNVGRQVSVLGIMAVGMTFVLVSREVDLSVGSTYAFASLITGLLIVKGWFLIPALIVGLVAGSAIGFVNGLLSTYGKLPSFIATLGTQFFWYGIATVLSGGKSYALRGAEESTVWAVLVGRPLAGSSIDWVQQLPIQSLWTAIIVAIMWFILNRHRFGEHTLFIGDSNDVSRVVGINVDREKIKLFTLMGALSAVAAVFLTLENKNYFGNQGQGYLLIAIASVLIGGTSIFGGRATIIGTVFGCFIIAMVEPGLVATGLTGAWVNTVRGLIFLVSIIFYLYVEEPQRRRAFFARIGGTERFGRMRSAE